MFISSWIVWTVATIAVLFIAARVGKTKADYDFVSPLLGLGVVVVYIAFVIGYLISKI